MAILISPYSGTSVSVGAPLPPAEGPVVSSCPGLGALVHAAITSIVATRTAQIAAGFRLGSVRDLISVIPPHAPRRSRRTRLLDSRRAPKTEFPRDFCGRRAGSRTQLVQHPFAADRDDWTRDADRRHRPTGSIPNRGRHR